MVAYVSPADLAAYLQKDLDTSTATLVIAKASALFSQRANTWFAPTSVTYQTVGLGYYQLYLPFYPVISVSAARVRGVTVTDYTVIRNVMYRITGWGAPGLSPPDLVEVDLMHGYVSVPDDVAAAVLEIAAAAYQGPDNTVLQEQIDDYSIKFAANAGGLQMTRNAEELAMQYRGSYIM